jgi:hypothetical protein
MNGSLFFFFVLRIYCKNGFLTHDKRFFHAEIFCFSRRKLREVFGAAGFFTPTNNVGVHSNRQEYFKIDSHRRQTAHARTGVRILLPIVLLLTLTAAAVGQGKYYFYTGKDFGSESTINPGSLLINGGYDILQSATHSRVISTINFRAGATNVWNNLKDPVTQIEKYGWGRFIGHEIFPTSLKLEKAQWFPNYTLHFLGGGMDARMMYEWYMYHGFEYPALYAGLTVAAYHFVNESVENDIYQGPNVDPIADIYFFNFTGALLFTSDAVAKFFSHTLHMTAWPGQPAWNPTYNTLENNGQYYIMKYKLPWADRTSLFYHFGDNGMLGLSYRHNENESVTMSAGFAARELRHVDVETSVRTVTVSLGWIAGLFYDKDNSVLASLMASNRINEKLRLNIYPGVFRLLNVSPGFFASIGRGDHFIAGITLRFLPFGLAYRSKTPPPPTL